MVHLRLDPANPFCTNTVKNEENKVHQSLCIFILVLTQSGIRRAQGNFGRNGRGEAGSTAAL